MCAARRQVSPFIMRPSLRVHLARLLWEFQRPPNLLRQRHLRPSQAEKMSVLSNAAQRRHAQNCKLLPLSSIHRNLTSLRMTPRHAMESLLPESPFRPLTVELNMSIAISKNSQIPFNQDAVQIRSNPGNIVHMANNVRRRKLSALCARPLISNRTPQASPSSDTESRLSSRTAR